MSQKIKITIPTPCHENWQKMSPAEKGRFCDSCQKNVFDFTKASDRQIIEAYNKNQNLCGRFLNTQLDRDLIAPKEKSSIWMATTSAIISFLTLGNQEIMAQETVKIEQTDNRILLGKPARNIVNPERTITGIVTDASGPLPGVNIEVKGTQRGVSAGFEGDFKIQANEGDTLVFSFMGMNDQNIIIGKSDIYNVTMNDDGKKLQGEIVIVKLPLYKRVAYKIRNLFR